MGQFRFQNTGVGGGGGSAGSKGWTPSARCTVRSTFGVLVRRRRRTERGGGEDLDGGGGIGGARVGSDDDG